MKDPRDKSGLGGNQQSAAKSLPREPAEAAAAIARRRNMNGGHAHNLSDADKAGMNSETDGFINKKKPSNQTIGSYMQGSGSPTRG